MISIVNELCTGANVATEWFLKIGNDERGPVSFRELVDLARTGRLTKTDLVRSTWHDEWRPASAVLHEHLSCSAPSERSAWDDAVNAAVAASRTRHLGRRSERANATWRIVLRVLKPRGMIRWPAAPLRWLGSLFQLLLQPFERVTDSFESATHSAWLSVGLRAACTILAAALVGMMLIDWSGQSALQHVWRTNIAGRGPTRYFPLVGPCDEFEYWFLFIDVIVGVAVAAYFVAGYLAANDD